ncbi:MAG: enoyl-CoA hydratase/isomerase family protein [Deltaproteobacteria bacterium]|nr:enoyl-CoA hydratase/isomerase family protein [Deltaproteobacteria bacterium]
MALVQAEILEGGKLLWLTLTAGKGNVLSMAVLEALGAELESHRQDQHLRAVVLQGGGGHFSFGASVEEHQKDQAAAMLATFHKSLRAVASFPVPVVALVQGKCLGGAFELALVCHLVLATPNAHFACPEIKLGVLPPVLAALGPARLGGAWTEKLVLTGGDLPLSAAESTGFATILPQTDDVRATALQWLQGHLLGLSAHSLRVATGLVRHSCACDQQGGLGAILDLAEKTYVQGLIPSHDGNEGIAAFLERRAPNWQDQ